MERTGDKYEDKERVPHHSDTQLAHVHEDWEWLESKSAASELAKLFYIIWRSRLECRNQAAPLHTLLFLSFVGLQILTHAEMLTAGWQS